MIKKFLPLLTISTLLPQCVSCMDSVNQTLAASASKSTPATGSIPLEERFQEVKPHLLNQAFKGSLVKIKNIIQPIRCIIAHTSETKEHQDLVYEVAASLKVAGLLVDLNNIWEHKENKLPRFIEKISTTERVVFFSSQEFMEKYDSLEEESPAKQALVELKTRISIIIPAILNGTLSTSFPIFMRGIVGINFNNPANYFDQIFELLKEIIPSKEREISSSMQEVAVAKQILNSSLSPDLMKKFIQQYEDYKKREEELDRQLAANLMEDLLL